MAGAGRNVGELESRVGDRVAVWEPEDLSTDRSETADEPQRRRSP